MDHKQNMRAASMPAALSNIKPAARETIEVIHPGSDSGKILRYMDEIQKEIYKSLSVSKDMFDK